MNSLKHGAHYFACCSILFFRMDVEILITECALDFLTASSVLPFGHFMDCIMTYRYLCRVEVCHKISKKCLVDFWNCHDLLMMYNRDPKVKWDPHLIISSSHSPMSEDKREVWRFATT